MSSARSNRNQAAAASSRTSHPSSSRSGSSSNRHQQLTTTTTSRLPPPLSTQQTNTALGDTKTNNDGTEFRDLLKGRIDIIEYLTSANVPGNSSDPNSDNGGSADSSRGGSQRNSTLSLLQQSALTGLLANNPGGPSGSLSHSQSGASLLAIAEQLPSTTSSVTTTTLLPPSAVPNNNPFLNTTTATTSITSGPLQLNTQQQHPQHPSCSSSSVSTASNTSTQPSPMDLKMHSQSGGPAYSQQQQQQQAPHNRVPESPPETDSGAGSASSPSSASENSPYSPDFNAFGNHLLPNGTVIHPPVGGGQNPLLHSAQGVILGVDSSMNNMPPTAYETLRPPRSVVQHHPSQDAFNAGGGGNAQAFASGGGNQQSGGGTPGQQPQHGSLAPAQVSPPNSGASTGNLVMPQSPYLIHNGGHHQSSGTPTGMSPLDASGLYSTLTTDAFPQLTGSAGSANSSRKRLRSDNASPRDTNDGMYDLDGYGGSQQAIKFNEFQPEKWHAIMDPSGRELPRLGYHVVADKGFNHSLFDTAFVNQKKNHFQIAVTIEAVDAQPPAYVRIEGGQVKRISDFRLNFYGVKAEMPSSKVTIKQSQTDRKPVEYEPVRLEIQPSRMTKVTVARLHFSETTMNNQRKNGRPNPDQKFFLLCVSLDAVTVDGDIYTIISFASEKVIVRASNPGQFDNGETDAHWQKTAGGSAVYHPGPVCIATERPQGALTVGGDIAYTGNLFHPSDRKLKENIETYDGMDALARMSQIRVVTYKIKDEIADKWELTEEQRHRVGVIAQELEQVLPDAVLTDGEYMQVDDQRIFYESAAAVKELCRLTGNLEYKIDEVEKISNKLKRLAKLKRLGSLKSVAQSEFSAISGPMGPGGNGISCSMSSLGSTGTTAALDKDRRKPDLRYASGKHKYSKGQCHHSCQHHPGLCTNKVIQTTIIALVAVMAFCLIAMATLYILDWQKRNYGGHHIPPDLLAQLQATAAEKGGCNRTTGGCGLPPGRMENGNPMDSAMAAAILPWLVKVPPLQSECKSGNCETYCCSAANELFVYSLNDSDVTVGESDVQMQLLLAPHDEADPVGSTFNVEALSHRVSRRSVGKRPKGTPAKQNPVKSHYVTMDVSPVQILLPDFNEVIDKRYCWGTSCNDKQNNYTFYIPVSRFMPLIPLQIRFQLNGPDQRFVQFCPKKDWTAEKCDRGGSSADPTATTGSSSGDADPTVEDRTKSVEEGPMKNSFQLPVGHFTRSTYEFRIGYSTELCNSDHRDVGPVFVQYTLIFYRVCSS